MVADIIISKKNESFLNIDCELGILYEIKEKFTFMVEGAKYSPKFKAKVWDGTISLVDLRFGTLPCGLYNELVEFATKLEYTVECKENTLYGSPKDLDDATYADVELFVNGLNLHSKNNKLDVRKYQIQAIHNCIHNNRQVSVTPTGGGKSLIAYCLYRWYLSKGKEHFMLVVPNLSLIKQMYSDFKDYSSHNGFDVEATTQIIAEGADKQIKKNLVLSTWQSVFKQPSKWFSPIDVILMDEVHQAKADSIKGIFEKATDVKYRFGMTGSLDKSAVNKMVIKGLIGEISKVKSTRDLIDDGHLSDIKIGCIILKYNKETKRLMKSADYHKEIDFICRHEGRNKFIRKLALAQHGNTLVLFNFVEGHGEPLYDQIKENATTQKIHFVAGKVEADERERIRQLVQDSKEDNIIIGSVGTFSTGVNLPRIHTIIFATPTKSVIRVMQSIGRGLRKTDDKEHLMLYDICDSINPSKSKPNHTMKHFVERLRIYSDEEHPYKIIEVQLENE